MKSKKQTPYERVTERIIELLKQGVCPWRRPWQSISILPQNFHTKRNYSGINLFLLNAIGYESPFYMTFKQIKERGGKVIKGSRGFPVVYWGTISVEDEQAKSDNTRVKEIPFLKQYIVFNADQVEGVDFPELQPRSQTEFQPILEAEQIVSNWVDCPEIRYGKRSASYAPDSDIINMPSQPSFDRSEEYYSTLFHEMGHATGHDSRLKRKFGKRFGDNQYSREELIAEMTSAFLCAECGMDNSVIENQASYLSGWMKVLKGDPKLVVSAASQAQKAANIILNRDYSAEKRRVA